MTINNGRLLSRTTKSFVCEVRNRAEAAESDLPVIACLEITLAVYGRIEINIQLLNRILFGIYISVINAKKNSQAPTKLY